MIAHGRTKEYQEYVLIETDYEKAEKRSVTSHDGGQTITPVMDGSRFKTWEEASEMLKSIQSYHKIFVHILIEGFG